MRNPVVILLVAAAGVLLTVGGVAFGLHVGRRQAPPAVAKAGPSGGGWPVPGSGPAGPSQGGPMAGGPGGGTAAPASPWGGPGFGMPGFGGPPGFGPTPSDTPGPPGASGMPGMPGPQGMPGMQGAPPGGRPGRGGPSTGRPAGSGGPPGAPAGSGPPKPRTGQSPPTNWGAAQAPPMSVPWATPQGWWAGAPPTGTSPEAGTPGPGMWPPPGFGGGPGGPWQPGSPPPGMGPGSPPARGDLRQQLGVLAGAAEDFSNASAALRERNGEQAADILRRGARKLEEASADWRKLAGELSPQEAKSAGAPGDPFALLTIPAAEPTAAGERGMLEERIRARLRGLHQPYLQLVERKADLLETEELIRTCRDGVNAGQLRDAALALNAVIENMQRLQAPTGQP